MEEIRLKEQSRKVTKLERTDLENYGFDEWFQKNIKGDMPAGTELARVTAVHKDSYTISNGAVDVHAELVGRLAFNAEGPLDFPAVGDWVFASLYDENTLGIIHKILPRKTLLKRKTSGRRTDYQLIAANIDTAFIVQSLDANFNVNRLERYLIMVYEGNITPVVLLSKKDLMTADEVDICMAKISETMPELTIVPFSNQNAVDVAAVKDLFSPKNTYCLLGSSGVGKTTLLNNLMGENRLKTATVREKDSKGKHTTTSRQLIYLPNKAMVIDTPGMRELGNFDVRTGMAETFHDITALAEKCKFKDCSHVHEKGCAVLAALETGELPAKRYDNFIKMNKEAKFNEMSYLEKKNRDKQFGKMVKSVMKEKKDRR